MKNKKTIIIVLCVLLVVAISAGFGVSSYIKTQNENAKEAINAEIDIINKIVDEDVDDVDRETLYKHFENRVVTKGKYAVVEDAAKSYAKDYYDIVFKMTDFMDDGQFENIISIDNIKNDGPEFEKTKAYIKEGKALFEECKEDYSKLVTSDAMNSYIEGKGLNDEQIKFYESIFEEWFMDEKDEEFYDLLDDICEYLEVAEKSINFLSENKDSWTIENDMIMFKTQKCLNEYNSIISELD